MAEPESYEGCNPDVVAQDWARRCIYRRRRRSKRLGAVLTGVVIVAAAALGVLRDDGGSAGSPEPPPATVIADPDDTPVIPFPSVPPATGDGVSSVDG